MVKIIIAIIVLLIVFPAATGVPGADKKSASGDDCAVCLEFFQFKLDRIYVVKSRVLKSDIMLKRLGVIREFPRRQIWIEIYIAQNNRIILHRIVFGKIIPAKQEEWKFDNFKMEDFS